MMSGSALGRRSSRTRASKGAHEPAPLGAGLEHGSPVAGAQGRWPGAVTCWQCLMTWLDFSRVEGVSLANATQHGAIAGRLLTLAPGQRAPAIIVGERVFSSCGRGVKSHPLGTHCASIMASSDAATTAGLDPTVNPSGMPQCFLPTPSWHQYDQTPVQDIARHVVVWPGGGCAHVQS